uniref:HesB n=1 Tax=Leptospirillum ferrooxidans TaxID=180 RepID=Q7X1K9_9BACT|nr:HesB [Leptospirillum ferrooxidans]
MISVTDKAADEVLKLAKTQKAEGKFLRLGIEGGGCSGMSYLIRFEEEPCEFDNVMEGPKGIKDALSTEEPGLPRWVCPDYQGNGLMGGGFKFQNPNATHSCGCGTSFAV